MGMKADLVWRVYATPNNPITCPILSLAPYLFSNLLNPHSCAYKPGQLQPTTETNLINPVSSEGTSPSMGSRTSFLGAINMTDS